jgi:hypothetical protein
MPPDLESTLAIIAMLALLKTTGLLLLLLHQTKLCRSRCFCFVFNYTERALQKLHLLSRLMRTSVDQHSMLEEVN